MSLTAFSSATVYEASGLQCMLPPAIKPLDDGWRVCGPALTVDTATGHNLWIHRAIYAAEPGAVLVVSTHGGYQFGYWGEIMATAAAERRLGGVVIDGCARDAAELRAIGVPVFARGLCIKGTGKRVDDARGIGVAIDVGGVTVNTGDVIVGDVDGIVAIPAALVDAVAERSAARVAKETGILKALRDGGTTLDLFGWS